MNTHCRCFYIFLQNICNAGRIFSSKKIETILEEKIMRYFVPLILLAAAVILCVCAAPSVVLTRDLAQGIRGGITLP